MNDSGTAPPLPLYDQLTEAACSAGETDDKLQGDSFGLTRFGAAAQKPLLPDLPVDPGFETGALLS